MRTPIVALLVLAASAPINSVIADSTPKRGDVIFAADFEGAQALDGWPAGTRLGSGYQAGQGIVIERPAGSAVGASMVFRPLPIERMRGCLVHFSAMVKAEDVSAKPVSWNGIKVMLVIEMPGGKQHPQADIGTGTFDWRHVVSAVRVPEDAISATLALGLESVTGRVWFDDLKVTIRKPPFVVTPRKVAGPLYKGHDLPRLRGAMVSPGVDAESLRTFGKDWNANLVRWQLAGWDPKGDTLDLSAYETWLAERLAGLDAALPTCEKYGLYVLVDLHSPPSGPAGSGKGLFTDKACQQKFVEVWQRMAHKYKSSKVVWGYDLVNEPIEGAVPEDLLDWQELAETTAKAVRAIDPDHAIIVESGAGGGPYGLEGFKPLDVPNVVYSVHMYLPHAFTHQGVHGGTTRCSYPGLIDGKMCDKAQLEAALKPVIDFQKNYGVPIYIGEFSAIRWAPDSSAYRYLRDVLDIFEKHGWDWSYHAFREWPGWSVEHSDDEHCQEPTAVPNDRQKLLRQWFAKNQKPRWQGREPSPAVVNPALRSPLRETVSLNGAWDFCTDPKLQGEAAGWHLPGRALPSARPLQVPGCWEAQGVGQPGLSSANNRFAYEPTNVKLRAAYTGAAWYKKLVAIPRHWAGKRIWLKLGSVNAQGWVWLNGTFIAHDWAYCGTWKYDVTDLVVPGEKATLAVLARNDVPGRRGESNCVRMYGGLLRGGELEATPAVSIDNAFVEPLFDQKIARLHVTLRRATPAALDGSYSLRVSVATLPDHHPTAALAQAVIMADGATTELTMDLALDPFRPWSPESPALYKAELVLKQGQRPIDGWSERFGMKKYEVRGGDVYLNNVRYFLRGCGDDHAYPITVCSPASREEHAKHLRIMKQYGFNYIRLHTHCEIPEYFEAADEVGMMVQPELPYYGSFGESRPYAHLSGAPLMAKDDLAELVTHMRRYTSLATYCGGNEGISPAPLDRQLYQMAKSLDPSRPWVNMDGGQNNTPENSELNNGGYGWDHAPRKDNAWPFVRHEYMSFGINEDPRLEAKYTGAFAPNQKLRDVKTFVTKQVGLDWKWAEACLDAGHRIQQIWHKIGIEATRVDPYLDGFSCWLTIDLSPSTQCGVLDIFWGKKSSTPEYFRQFNAPTVIVARTAGPKPGELLGLNPATLIYSEGDGLDVDWVVSHFQSQPLKDATLAWRLVAGEKTLASGQIEHLDVAAGTVPIVGRSRITMPTVRKAVRATLMVGIDAAESHNSWDMWLFPRFSPQSEGGRHLAASPAAFPLLAGRYPGLAKLGTPAANAAPVVVARSLDEPGVLDALQQGKRVICLSLPGYHPLQPGTELTAWSISNQTGTAIAAHPAFGDFPHRGYLDQGWFRLVGTAEKLDAGHNFRGVEPLMVGIGRATGYGFGTLGYPLGFNLYAFQARAGRGRLLATGLNLVGENPEAVYLLDQFIRYARSEAFDPQGTFDVAQYQQVARRRQEFLRNFNGWAATLRASERTDWHTFLGPTPMCVVRQTDGRSSVVWQTGPWKPDDKGRVTFRWVANLGWQSQPAGGRFSLSLGKEQLLDFDITLTSTTWKSADGSLLLRYTVKSIDRGEDSSGIMELTVPRSRLPKDGAPVTLRVDGSKANSLRYFGLQELSP